MTTTRPQRIYGSALDIPSARREVRRIAGPAGREAAYSAQLLTDELLTNAVRHGGGQFLLEATTSGSMLKVRVTDIGTSDPVTVFHPGHWRDGGRGLTIVESLASEWGIERSEGGKTVWFELDLGADADPPAGERTEAGEDQAPS